LGCERRVVLAAAALLLAACSDGDGVFEVGGGGGGGSSGGDQLYLGTVAGSSTSGTLAIVVHPKEGSSGSSGSSRGVDAKITTASKGGPLCQGPANPNSTCGAGQVLCQDGCCPSDFPFHCAGSQNCWASAEAAQIECGASCLSCNGVSAPDNQGTGGASSVILTGTLSDDGTLSAAGEGWNLSGQIDGQLVEGGFSGPGGEDGSFSAADATDNDVVRYCGSFDGDDSGTWNLQVGGGMASGSFAGSFAGGVLEGTASSSSIELQFVSTDASGTASGQISGGSVSGTWSGSGFAGSWSGTTPCMGTDSVSSADDCCMQTARGLACPIEGC
jgi:hypothetical protein